MIYKVYWTDLNSKNPCSAEFDELQEVLVACEVVRKQGHTFVTMVSDYACMVGKPGVSGSDTGYVAQMLA